MSSSEADATRESDLVEQKATYRRHREQIERSILSLATSVDGVSFELQASLRPGAAAWRVCDARGQRSQPAGPGH